MSLSPVIACDITTQWITGFKPVTIKVNCSNLDCDLIWKQSCFGVCPNKHIDFCDLSSHKPIKLIKLLTPSLTVYLLMINLMMLFDVRALKVLKCISQL